MLTITECREILKDTSLSDEEIAELRNSLYFVIGNLLDKYYEEQHTE